MIEDNHIVRAAEMEMFSSACRLGKVFDKYNSNISKIILFPHLHYYCYFWGVYV